LIVGSIHVFTFKEGVLSAVAHDLRFRFERFLVTLDGSDLRAEFDLRSLRLDGPVEHGVVRPDAFDDGRRADVENAMHRDVLRTPEHPTAHFVGRAVRRDEGYDVTGELDLAGRRAPLSFSARSADGAFAAHVELVPSRWGIAPYKALLGAIRLKDRVRVDLALRES